MSQEQIVVDVQPIATEVLESMEAPLREGVTDANLLVEELSTKNDLLSQEHEESWREVARLDQEIADARDEIWGLKKEVSANDWEMSELERQVELRNKALAIGGGVAGAISIAAILGYVKERKVHKQIVALIEETAIQLAAEEIQSDFISFNELVSHVSLRLSEFEVRSFRRPFAIPAKELERTTDLLIGMLRTAETLAMQYANLETANTIDVEGKE